MNHLPTEKLPLLPQAPKLQLNPLIVTLTIIPRVIPHLLFFLSRCSNRCLTWGPSIINMTSFWPSPSQFRLFGIKLRYCEKATRFKKDIPSFLELSTLQCQNRVAFSEYLLPSSLETTSLMDDPSHHLERLE